jgi:hypothetical protein
MTQQKQGCINSKKVSFYHICKTRNAQMELALSSTVRTLVRLRIAVVLRFKRDNKKNLLWAFISRSSMFQLLYIHSLSHFFFFYIHFRYFSLAFTRPRPATYLCVINERLHSTFLCNKRTILCFLDASTMT